MGCKIAVPSSAVYSRFLYWMLKWATPEIHSRASGTTFAEISGKKFAESSVVLPPLAEQHRIVEALEDHNSRIDAATLAVERSQQRVTRWAAVSTLNAFRSSAEERWATIGEVCRVHVGATPSRSDPVLWNGDLPWVSSGEVNFRTICDTREQINREKIGKSRIHPPGTVLLAMIGEGKTRGQVAILGVAAAHNQNCASIRVDESPLDSQYLYHFLKGRYEETRSGGSGGVQPALNKAKVESIKVPIVSRANQERVVEAAEEIETTKAKLLRDLSRVSGRADALRMALLRAAFTGQLVDQDPADEPASALLRRTAFNKSATRRRSSRKVPTS